MDRIDFAILGALQNDGRMSNKELAAAAGLAPSSCHQRVRNLEQAGAIRGYRARVDPAVLGVGLQALVTIQLKVHSREFFDSFREHLRTIPEVVVVFQLAGADDFMVHMVARDPQHLRDVTLDELATRPEVSHINTSLLFNRWRAPAWPDLTRR